MSESEVASIIRVIKESFRDTPPLPPSDPIIGHHPESERFLNILRDKNWVEFLHILERDDDGRSDGQIFFFMTPKAYHYFAPALLIFSMDERADFMASAFFGTLLPDDSKYEYVQERLNLFSEAQKHAVALVVHYYYGRYGTTLKENEDLVTYWAPRLNGSPI